MILRVGIGSALACCFALSAEPDFSVPATPPSIQVASTERRGEVEIRDITFDGVSGEHVRAFLVSPLGSARLAATLYVHWYDPAEPNSNRLEFLPEAIDLARKGQLSLLVDTMWSDPAWYGNRVQAADYDESVKQVKNLRRALDVLSSDPRVDPERVALVGHDFGGIYGAVAAASDPRVKALVTMTAAANLSDWYMYGKFKLEGDARRQYVERMAPFDAVQSAARVKGPVLLQFADSDFYVPQETVAAYRKAQPDRSRMTILLYNSGHGWDAARDRNAFLIGTLHLRRDPADLLLDYFAARNEGDAGAIDAFHAPDYRTEARRDLYAFEKATKAHFEYRTIQDSGDSITIDLYESSEYLEALGSGVSMTRITYRFRDGRIRKAETISRFDARRPYEQQSKAFADWVLREHPAEAGKVLDRGRVRMAGDTAAAVLELAKEWRLHPNRAVVRP